jgi:putative CocE/NonD family hydrolase
VRVEWNVPIEMDDGVVLRADVFRPDDDGAHPVIVSCGPYGKGLSFAEGFPGRWGQLVDEHPEVVEETSARYANFEMPDPEKWVPDGYVCVRNDSRGAGRSPGHLCLFQERETLDLYKCVEWAARQPWSNGKVGLSGISRRSGKTGVTFAQRCGHTRSTTTTRTTGSRSRRSSSPTS